jgi:hypothetical protein
MKHDAIKRKGCRIERNNVTISIILIGMIKKMRKIIETVF